MSDKTLVEVIKMVKKGNIKGEVELLLRRADILADDEWIYYIDEYSG